MDFIVELQWVTHPQPTNRQVLEHKQYQAFSHQFLKHALKIILYNLYPDSGSYILSQGFSFASSFRKASSAPGPSLHDMFMISIKMYVAAGQTCHEKLYISVPNGSIPPLEVAVEL